MPLCASVYMCLVITCWERADLLAFVCGVLLLVCHFPIGILGQVWYLIASIPDLCTLTYFTCRLNPFNLIFSLLEVKTIPYLVELAKLILLIFIMLLTDFF